MCVLGLSQVELGATLRITYIKSEHSSPVLSKCLLMYFVYFFTHNNIDFTEMKEVMCSRIKSAGIRRDFEDYVYRSEHSYVVHITTYYVEDHRYVVFSHSYKLKFEENSDSE